MASYQLEADDGTEEDSSDSASSPLSDADIEHQDQPENYNIPTVPGLATPRLLRGDSTGLGALLPEEIPDSQEDPDTDNLLLPHHNSSWSFETEETVLITGDTTITPKVQAKYVSLSLFLDCPSTKPPLVSLVGEPHLSRLCAR